MTKNLVLGMDLPQDMLDLIERVELQASRGFTDEAYNEISTYIRELSKESEWDKLSVLGDVLFECFDTHDIPCDILLLYLRQTKAIAPFMIRTVGRNKVLSKMRRMYGEAVVYGLE